MSPGGIVERTDELSEKVGRLQQFNELASQAEALRTRLQQLGEREAILTVLAELTDRLNAIGIDVGTTSNGLAEARGETLARREEFSRDPLTATDPQDSSFRFSYLRSLDTITENVRRRLLLSWQAYLRAQAPELHEDLLSVLGRIGKLSQPVQEIRQLQTNLEQSSAALPQDDASIHAALDTTKKLRERWTALPVEDIDASVMDFLRSAVGPDGAPVAGLTTDIRAWLEEHGLLESLRISFP
jgi:DNA repair exonuclease SbcCD ATPase subunit